MTLAKKLLMGSGPTERPEVKGAVEFVSPTPMTITPKYTNSGVTLQYSLNGTSWTTIASEVITPSANIIYFRGSASGTKSLYTNTDYNNFWTFTGATNLECNGKLDRLLQDDLGGDNDILVIGNYCFAGLFRNVYKLIKAPELPATTLAVSCYYSMFENCTSLTIAPELPAMTLTEYCYYSMFRDCTALSTAPALPATTMANSCYDQMFRGCKDLTTAPALPATTMVERCYFYMFRDCTALSTAPALPATTMANSCYDQMFSSCTSLTTLPKLPTLKLQVNCYYAMFYNCTKIKLSTTLTGIYGTAYRIPITGTGTIATNALTSMFTSTGGTFTGTPTINTIYYTENTPV